MNKTKSFLALAFISLSLNCFGLDLPNPAVTPGAINPYVNQTNINETICVKGYTKTIRPPNYYTSKLKRKQIGYGGDMRAYEEDHLIPLSIGGSPTDERNLWPQPRNTEFNAEMKDKLELRLMTLVCHGTLPLSTAQHAIAQNWIEAYKKYGGEQYHHHWD